jgi:energy-coupling factor transporter ATP-binding protein EcfA2
VVLLGLSGSGKSTLLCCINRLGGPAPGRLNKTFLRGFNVEDLILYVFSLLTLVIFAVFFYQHYVTTVRPESAEPLAVAWLAPAGNDICLDYIKAQVTNIALRYDQARIATATNAVRRSLAFLIGMIGFMLGCIIVIRGVRDAPVEAELSAENKARVRLVTSSSGMVVVVLSAIIIMGVVLLDDKVEVRDEGMALPQQCVAAPLSATELPAHLQK